MSLVVSLERDRIGARRMRLGPHSAGVALTPKQFDEADYDAGWRYELINGVLIVSPIPLLNEADPNDDLGYLLRTYQESHPEGVSLDLTVPERHVRIGKARRRADRLIWAGLGRLPELHEPPTIIVEFVSKGKRSHLRDYEEKRREYQKLRIAEYWLFNRFEETLIVFSLVGTRYKKRALGADEIYSSPLLPGFKLPVKRLLRLANRWPDESHASE